MHDYVTMISIVQNQQFSYVGGREAQFIYSGYRPLFQLGHIYLSQDSCISLRIQKVHIHVNT